MQNLVDVAEILQHRGQHDEAQDDFHPRHPTTAARQLLQVRREESQQKEWRGEAGCEGRHPENGLQTLGLHGGDEQRSDERADAGERG